MRQIVLFVFIIMLFLAWFVNAVETNYVRITIYDVDGTNTNKNIITTAYSDGLGRAIQSKQLLSGGQGKGCFNFL